MDYAFDVANMIMTPFFKKLGLKGMTFRKFIEQDEPQANKGLYESVNN